MLSTRLPGEGVDALGVTIEHDRFRAFGALPGEVPYGWTKDGGLLVGRALEAPIEIYRIDLRAQRRAPWKVIRPTAAGAYALTRIQFAPAMMDVSAYSYVSWKTHLYLVEGLR